MFNEQLTNERAFVQIEGDQKTRTGMNWDAPHINPLRLLQYIPYSTFTHILHMQRLTHMHTQKTKQTGVQ